MTNRMPADPCGPLAAVPEQDLPAWAWQAARRAGLDKAVHEYPEQVAQAAAAARRTLLALQDDMSGMAGPSRPTWRLSK